MMKSEKIIKQKARAALLRLLPLGIYIVCLGVSVFIVHAILRPHTNALLFAGLVLVIGGTAVWTMNARRVGE